LLELFFSLQIPGKGQPSSHFEVLEDSPFTELRQSPGGDVKQKYHDAFGLQGCLSCK
jgi:hypothetical protein